MGLSTVAAVVGAATSIYGASEGARQGKENRKLQERMLKESVRSFDDIDIPSLSDQEIELLAPELVGEYSPQEIRTILQQQSDMEKIKADPEAVAEQKAALEQMSEISEAGVTEGDKAAMREIRRDVGQSAKARRETILNEMAQRGVLGSGMELAAQLKGNQEATQMESEAGDRAIQQAQARAMQALANRGTMASQIRSQSFGEQADAARAKDAINQFNIANQQANIRANQQEQNRAQLMNLQARQTMAAEKQRLRNQEEMYNKQLQQQRFQNQLSVASGRTGAAQAQADAAAAAAAAGAKGQAGLISAGAGAIGTIGGLFSGGSGGAAKVNPNAGNTEIDAALNKYGSSGNYSPFTGQN